MVIEKNADLANVVIYQKYVQLSRDTLGDDVAESPLTQQLIELVHTFGPGTKFVDDVIGRRRWSTRSCDRGRQICSRL